MLKNLTNKTHEKAFRERTNLARTNSQTVSGKIYVVTICQVTKVS